MANEPKWLGHGPIWLGPMDRSDLKAEVQRKLRVDKQQQLEGVGMELEAANSKGNSRQLFRIVKSMTRKFHPRLQGIQSATGENLTEAAQIAKRWKGYFEDLYCDKEGKGTEQEYRKQEHPPECRSTGRIPTRNGGKRCTRHASTNNYFICALWTSRRHSTISHV